MFEQTFKNVDDILQKDAGCSSELDYVEQTSWILFLKYLDDLERDNKIKAELKGEVYTDIISPEYKWEAWAVPKDKDGKIDYQKELTGKDLINFVNLKLFTYLTKFKVDAESADTIEYKIGEIFSELRNKIQSGYILREILNMIDELHFRSQAEKHEMSHLYEDKINKMGNAGRNGGEYETNKKLKIKLCDGKEREIQHMISTSFWSADGKPISAQEFLQNLFGILPEYFKDENELRTIWSNPITRSAFLEKLAVEGYGKDVLITLQKLINAEKSDLFDVLEYVSFALQPITREMRVNRAQSRIYEGLNDKQKEFLDFVLAKYIETGVEELSQDKLPRLLELKYHTIRDATEVLGGITKTRELFIGFKEYLYAPVVA